MSSTLHSPLFFTFQPTYPPTNLSTNIHLLSICIYSYQCDAAPSPVQIIPGSAYGAQGAGSPTSEAPCYRTLSGPDGGGFEVPGGEEEGRESAGQGGYVYYNICVCVYLLCVVYLYFPSIVPLSFMHITHIELTK